MNIAINGFGRIGRLFFRQAFGNPDINIVAVNDLGNAANLAYLLKYDSVYRIYDKEVSVDDTGENLIVDGKKVRFLSQKDPAQLPWKDLNVDVVLEATGVFESYEKAKYHIDAGAKRVILTAPAKDPDTDNYKTILIGVNEEKLSVCQISSNASCTTNAAAPVIAVLSETPGIVKAVLNTVHAYTATQNLVDGPVKGDDLRRGRSAAQNIVPSTTGAAIAVTRTMPELEGKFDGISMRVPVVSGSIVDITFVSKRKTSVDEINSVLKSAAVMEKWAEVLAVTEDQIVSSDIIGTPYASIVDLKFTKVIDGDLVKVLAWYDNEWGYASVLLKHVLKIKEVVGYM